jgi:glycosyltransferase involved in cell wall biosynthesis
VASRVFGQAVITERPRVRVVRIIDRLNIGGPAKHVVWLTSRLDPRQFETTLVTGTIIPGEGDMSYFARKAGITPILMKELSRELGLRDIVVMAKLIRKLWTLKPHIVHTHKSKAGAVGRVAATIYKWLTPSALCLRPRQCQILHTYHGHIFHSYYGPAKTRLFLSIERVLARITDRIITISRQQQQEILEQFKVGRRDQFQVIPLGIDLDEAPRPDCHLRRQLGAADDEVLIGTVGRLCEVKNHAMLIEAASRVSGKNGRPPVPARFVVVGDGHLRNRLESRVRELSIRDKVVFTGFRADVLSLYSEFDFVVLTSLNEGTPLSLIEAMSCGRAIAATEVGGVVDLMGERRNWQDGFCIWDHGVTVPSRDVEAFARALVFLAQRPDLRRQMGDRARRFVRSRLSMERLIRDVETLYRNLSGTEAANSQAATAAV